MNDNTGHGHVWARPDGVKMRCGCGGPKLYAECARDAARIPSELDKVIQLQTGNIVLDSRDNQNNNGWIQLGYILQMQHGNYVALLGGAYWCAIKIDGTDDEFVRKIWIKEKTHNIARLSAELWLEENSVVI